jgi:hypothetical protein
MQSDFAPHHHASYRSIEQQPPAAPLEHMENVVDDEGYWRKRLLAFIQSMFVLLLILVGLNFFTGLTSGHFSLVPFFPLMFLWIVLYVGHIGAHKRRASFLHAYFILNVLIITFVTTTFIMFPAVLGSILCTLDGGYGGGCSWGEAKAIAHVTFIGFLFAFIPCLPAAMGAIYALRARNELLMAQLRASVEAELGVVLDGRSSSADEHLGLLHSRPVPSPVPASPQQRYYYSCDYRPMVYVPNPPYFSSATSYNGAGPSNGTSSPQLPQQPLQFPAPPPTGYFYYPPPPPRSAGMPSAPSAPASSSPTLPAASPAAPATNASTNVTPAMPPSVPQSDDKH